MADCLMLVDASSYIFRAFFAVRRLTSPLGTPTNALFGFKQMVLSLLTKEQPSHVAMVFDTAGGSFRNEIYPLYKANRGAPPEDLVPQFPLIRQLTELLQLPVVDLAGYEADDLIGTLATRFQTQIPIKIVSGDKDLAQLITSDVKMLDTMKEVLYGPDEVKEKWGVLPSQIMEYLALVGDTSDNIPGAAGIGPKTAVKLFEEFGNLEGIYNNLEKIKGKVKENLESSRNNVELSKQLTQIVCDLELGYQLDDFRLGAPDRDGLRRFYKEMGFREDAFFIQAGHAQEEPATPSDWDYDRYQAVQSQAAFDQLLQALQQQSEICFDFETTSLVGVEAKIVGISFAWADGNPVYVPLGHDSGVQLPLEPVLAALRPLWEDPTKTWIAQNVKYELMVLANYDIEIKGQIHDSMIQSYLLDANSHRHNLDELAKLHLNHAMISFKDLCGTGKKQILFSQTQIPDATRYAAEDADATWQIHNLLFPNVQAQPDLLKLYQEMELPLARCLARMERAGICLDAPYLHQLNGELTLQLKALEGQIYQVAGQEFNLNSTQQLGEILFEKMGISEGTKKTKTGYSTDASVLEKLAPKYPIAQLMLEYRTLTKLIGTYLSPLPELISPNTGRIHTSFSATTAATGRLASSNPNLQNIPIRGEEGAKIRHAFVAAPGKLLISADYSQIELRFLAHLSNDPGMIELFASGGDIHRETAAAIFGRAGGLVTPEQRRAAKAINFGIIYGMGAFRLAQETGVSNKEAKAFIDAYFERFPGIQSFMDESVAMAQEQGFVTTLFGRKREITGINSKNHMERMGAERIAVNSRIQGSAADLIKLAMIALDQEFAPLRPANNMILQVHDELVFEVDEGQETRLMPQIKARMENAAQLKVPLLVEAGCGKTWGTAH